MAQRNKTLQQQVDELRAEIAALQAERALAEPAPAAADEAAPPPEAEPEEPEIESGEDEGVAAGIPRTLGDLEKALSGLIEATEDEIAERPVLVAGLAFLAGVALGRMTKGSG